MNATQATEQCSVDDVGIAHILKVSVGFVRKDRRGNRLIPFYRIGTLVRYDPQAVREAMLARQEGGARAKK